jgi:hypothetical protein
MYNDYKEIPFLIKEYLKVVASVYTIQEIPLSDINSYLTGLQEYSKIIHENETDRKSYGNLGGCP